jgi:hypothetical protein
LLQVEAHASKHMPVVDRRKILSHFLAHLHTGVRRDTRGARVRKSALMISRSPSSHQVHTAHTGTRPERAAALQRCVRMPCLIPVPLYLVVVMTVLVAAR